MQTSQSRTGSSGPPYSEKLRDLRVRLHATYARSQVLSQELQTTWAYGQNLWQQSRAAQEAARCCREWRTDQADQRWLLEHSLYARMLARLETMPVIEQAKGIIMAQTHCSDSQAFDRLRQASQRSNIPVRELAAAIVASTTQSRGPGRDHAPLHPAMASPGVA